MSNSGPGYTPKANPGRDTSSPARIDLARAILVRTYSADRARYALSRAMGRLDIVALAELLDDLERTFDTGPAGNRSPRSDER